MTAARLPAVARVLVLEDSDLDAELIAVHLARSSVQMKLSRASHRRAYEQSVGEGGFDLVLADYSLPDFDGLAALRLARDAMPDVPFVFVSGVVGEEFATEALRQGATDYVLKRNLSRLNVAIERALAEAGERRRRRQAEAALGTSETNVRLAVEAAGLGWWQCDVEGLNLTLDARCQALFGLDLAQVTIDRLIERTHPADREGLRAALDAALRTSERGVLQHELRSLGHDGREHWVAMRGELMQTVGGAPQLLGVLQDVTEQRMAADRQRHAELMFRLAAEASELGVWELDVQTGKVWIDDGIRRMAELPPHHGDAFDSLVERIVHPDDIAHVRQALQEAAKPGGNPTIDYEHRLIGAQQHRVRWLAVKGRRVDGSDGSVRLVGTARDISRQKRQDLALRRAYEALEERVELRTRENERIWSLSPDLMAVCRQDGTVVAVNPAWQRQLDWPVERLLEAPVFEFVDVADVDTARASWQRLTAGETLVRFDARLPHRRGDTHWLRWSASLDTGVVYLIGRDVTAERAAADELAATNRELKSQIVERGRVEATLQQMQRLEAVGQLTSGVAHDFNNLLTVVLSNISLIRRLLSQGPEPDPRIVQRLDSMRSAASRGATLTSQLLAFSRRQRLEPQAVHLNEVVEGMRDLLQTTIGGSVKLQTDLGHEVWPALVDPTQLELIILNLAINARDAMEVGGSLTLHTANRVLEGQPGRPEEPEPGEYVALSVADTGSGMTPEVLAKAFEPFFTTKEVGRGSGLGLAQVYGFAKQSGGGVGIDTRVGVGTTVHVYIPRARELEAKAPPDDAPPPAGDVHDGTPHTLLVVDDDALVREVTSSMLDELGYRVVQAGGGDAALRLLREREDIDLVLADFAMPGMNGAEMARLLRRSHPQLPVLFYTGYVDLAALKDVPEEFVLQKPLREDELARRLQRLLGMGTTAA